MENKLSTAQKGLKSKNKYFRVRDGMTDENTPVVPLGL